MRFQADYLGKERDMSRFFAYLIARFDAWRANLPADPDPQPTAPSRFFDPQPERSELHSLARYAR